MKKEPVILVVDDEEEARRWVHEALEDQYRLIDAPGGKDALSELNLRGDISAIILDLVMPGVDGFDVLSELIKTPEHAAVPVFVLTNQKEEIFEANALKLGAMDYATKGIRKDVFRLRLANLLKRTAPPPGPVQESYDDLTGFFKRNPFYQKVAERMEVGDREYDLLAMDISHFSLINAQYGMKEGDRLLSWIAEVVRKEFGKDLIMGCRLYADRFIFLMEKKVYESKLVRFSERVLSAYPLETDIRVKFGIYEITDPTQDVGKMCECAYSAVNMAKDHFNLEYAFYSEETHSHKMGEKHLTDNMRKALNEEQFQIYLQPKFDIDREQIIGAESLVRWVHPERGLIPPGEFIPLFERNGFVSELDTYVWNKTAELVADWKKTGRPVVPVSVNVSRNDIYSMDILKVIPEIIEEHKIAPELLHLEITETAYVDSPAKLAEVTDVLRKSGFIIEMDDFGSGYSSLNMLGKLSLDILKIDRNFIRSLEQDANSRLILEYIIGLAKWMNLSVIAEGVEGLEELNTLKRMECHYVQGYYYSPPVPVDQFNKLVDKVGTCVMTEIEEKKRQKDLVVRDASDGQRSMLIVEDLAMNRAILRDIFSGSFAITEAINGISGLEYLLNGGRCDIVMLDINMPGMDGFEMLKRMKSNSDLTDLPVLITSQISPKEKNRLISLGASGFIAKPYTKEAIEKIVHDLLGEA